MKEAQIFIDSYKTCQWLLQNIPKALTITDKMLTKRIVRKALVILEELTLAVQGYETLDHVMRADESVALIRVEIRLAMEQELLSVKQYQYLIEQYNCIGRQIGGWLKSLNEIE